MDDTSRKIFVGGLPYKLNEEEFAEFFSSCGKVVSAKIVNDRETGRSRGFGFVEFETEEAAQAAVQLENPVMGGREIKISIARPKEERPMRQAA